MDSLARSSRDESRFVLKGYTPRRDDGDQEAGRRNGSLRLVETGARTETIIPRGPSDLDLAKEGLRNALTKGRYPIDDELSACAAALDRMAESEALDAENWAAQMAESLRQHRD